MPRRALTPSVVWPGARLIPLEELRRPRVDVMLTLSGIFRDLLPLQTKMLAEAAWLAASAEEPEDMNYIRKHTLAVVAETGASFEDAAFASSAMPMVPMAGM